MYSFFSFKFKEKNIEISFFLSMNEQVQKLYMNSK